MNRASSNQPGDLAYVAVKAALSAVPVAGGPLAEIFAFLVTEPVSKRRDAWITEIARRLQDLETQLNRPLIQGLQKDESFTTVLLNASQVAARNHQRAKVDALANAVINAALGAVPDDTERAIMLALIDRLTPSHLAILAVMKAPGDNRSVSDHFRNVMTSGLVHVIFAALPELSGRKELVELIWRDLVDAGLVRRASLNDTVAGSGLLEKRTTAFGDLFLEFIRAPKL